MPTFQQSRRWGCPQFQPYPGGDSKPSELLIESSGVDQNDTYVFEVVPQAMGESMAKSLSYWITGKGDDTMITIWNPADEAQDFGFTLYFSGGSSSR
jgi:hypothetical protein